MITKRFGSLSRTAKRSTLKQIGNPNGKVERSL